MKKSYIYILTNKNKTVLYTGVTNNIVKRTYEHKNHITKGFAEKYNVDQLIYYEEYDDISDAIQREKNIKKWKREWKVELINTLNPTWKDLYEEICG